MRTFLNPRAFSQESMGDYINPYRNPGTSAEDRFLFRYKGLSPTHFDVGIRPSQLEDLSAEFYHVCVVMKHCGETRYLSTIRDEVEPLQRKIVDGLRDMGHVVFISENPFLQDVK